MVFIGSGIDIVDIRRISVLLHGVLAKRFVSRVISPIEYPYLPTNHEKMVRHIAKRWCAKEAIAKAFGCGISKNLTFHDIEVLNETNGQPICRIIRPLLSTPNFTGETSLLTISVSMADCTDYANAHCIIFHKN